MSISAGDVALFIFGLVPQYVSFSQVERHYTNFWTGFWNIYGLIGVAASLVLSKDDPILQGEGVIVILLLSLTLFLVLYNSWSSIPRNLGASLLTTSLSWGMLVWFASNDLGWGFIAGLSHFVILLLFHYRKEIRIQVRK